jgi:hypothetical protein
LADGHAHSLPRDGSHSLNQDIRGPVVEIVEQGLGFAWRNDAKTTNRVQKADKMIPKRSNEGRFPSLRLIRLTGRIDVRVLGVLLLHRNEIDDRLSPRRRNG